MSCTEWTGTIVRGYGQTTVDGQRRYAHRVAYEQAYGPVPAGLVLDHLCRNRACVNPAHLEPVTQRVNILRGNGIAAKNAIKTQCAAGHGYTPENTIPDRVTGRRCRECNRRRGREYMARRRAEERSAK